MFTALAHANRVPEQRTRDGLMPRGFVHQIDPILFDAVNVYFWWYGLGFALGFLELHFFVMRNRAQLHLSRRSVWNLTLLMTLGVLAGGRAVEVTFDEWFFYGDHPELIPWFWLGGMATHGLMAGGLIAAWGFARWRRLPFHYLADVLVIPAAFLLGMGRIGNFIDGQIVGSVTDVWWGVQFPDADGLRHPVVLYDGAKNLVLMAYLIYVRRTSGTPGAVASRFVFWYAAPRIVVDLFRDYPTHVLLLGTGQTLNILMALLGLALLYRSRLRRLGRLRHLPGRAAPLMASDPAPGFGQRLAFVLLLMFCLTIPSNWTQDIPDRYGNRHPHLVHSRLYPDIDTAPPE